MIVFDLLCICGVQFEGWFHDSEGFRDQQKAGLLSCPTCGATDVHKILSPVAVITGSSARNTPAPSPRETPQAAWATTVLDNLQKYIRKNFEDVGPNLATEALKIHYGTKEPRNIRGVASAEEEKTLQSEGIKLLKIPMLSREEESNN
jgi:hypothetical protein